MDYTSICSVQRATDRSGCLKYSLRSEAISNMDYIPVQKTWSWWRSTLRTVSGATLASFTDTYLVLLFLAGCMLIHSSKHYNRVECWSPGFMLFYPAFRYIYDPGRNYAAHWTYSGSVISQGYAFLNQSTQVLTTILSINTTIKQAGQKLLAECPRKLRTKRPRQSFRCLPKPNFRNIVSHSHHVHSKLTKVQPTRLPNYTWIRQFARLAMAKLFWRTLNNSFSQTRPHHTSKASSSICHILCLLCTLAEAGYYVHCPPSHTLCGRPPTILC